MTAEVALSQGPQATPDAVAAIEATFKQFDVCADGSIHTNHLAAVMQTLDGSDWTEQEVRRLIEGAGGCADGRVRVDCLIKWLFDAGGAPPPPPAVEDTPLDEIEPSSPKVPSRKKRDKEKRAYVYEPRAGETLYSPESHTTGVLLIRKNGTFAYVHDDKAKFSEGIQGDWSESEEREDAVSLEPRSFGFCYTERFSAKDIVGVCYTVRLGKEPLQGSDRYACVLPEHIVGTFSWLDPTKEEAPAELPDGDYDEPCSPKIPSRKKNMPWVNGQDPPDLRAPTKSPANRKSKEVAASVYALRREERVYCLDTLRTGRLLLRPDGSFAYVHDASARFSEGVEGGWRTQFGNMVRLEPKSFGWCYEGSFPENEILDACYTVTLSEDQTDDGMFLCTLAHELLGKCSWLDPSQRCRSNTAEVEPAADDAAEGQTEGQEDSDPISPRIVSCARRMQEKRACKYLPESGEQLYAPESYTAGILLLRPEGTFAYVHDSTARFSEGVQGDWTQQPRDKVLLEPTTFGWCYADTFDDNEILGVPATVQLCKDKALENGLVPCVLEEKFTQKFSWLDPTLPE
mmetsp:Transcript_39092/g.110471  ORF Transcript_39092/g.110471 Transcript_39092/m.110471 type:complete len:572 (+) Transcript_39092:110-1825(+)